MEEIQEVAEEVSTPVPQDLEDVVVPISPEPHKSPADAETAEAAKSPPAAEPPEGEGGEATVGEKSQPAAEESPALEGADQESLAEGQPEHATSSEGPGEAEAPKDGEEEDKRAPSEISSLEKLEEQSGAPEVASRLSLLRDLPTSVSFDEGELPEPSPLQVGVELGQRLSRTLWELEQRHASSRSLDVSASPESELGAVEGETEEQREQRVAEEQRQRTELIEQYRQLLAERGRLRSYNTKLQGKLAELLNKAKGKDRVRELEQHISDWEQRYSRYLAMLEKLRNQQAEETAWYQKEIDALQRSCDQKLAKVESEWKTYQAVKKEVAVYTMGRRLGGKQAAIKEVDKIQAKEQSKEREMTEVRLENIKLKHRIQKIDASLKAQEELAEGLHLIDFEQLKIENQTYNEKIEERNEELQKLRRKVTNTVQVLSQVKEKLQFVEAENQGQKAQLMAVESLGAQNRDILTRTKQARDKLRIDNQRLQQKCGLLGNTLLLRDFEEKVDAAEILKEKLEILKRNHAGLSLTCNGIKKKIKGAKSFLPF
ncbi:coiled-coil domain-containing protein 96 [Protobothrops mucrosquamatus]|uniref:coiled-coil domain-containing protein 96 n=1 Tax=Protobothrops mucrosquamatus TaxID=103944 RepID=UPI000775C5A8|nr:coiled-coil domain-containing protein 96 [Protobothrops mucrosquamatus]